MFVSCTASESSSQKTSASALLSKVCKSLGHCVQFKAWDLSHRLGSARWRRSWIHLFHSVLSKAVLFTAPGHPLSSPRRKQRAWLRLDHYSYFFLQAFPSVISQVHMSTQSFLIAARGRTCPAQPCCPRKLGFPTEAVPASLGDKTQPCTGPADKLAPKPHSSFHFSLLLFHFFNFPSFFQLRK